MRCRYRTRPSGICSRCCGFSEPQRSAGRDSLPEPLCSAIPRRDRGISDLILYTTEDGRSQIKLRAKDQPVWLTQRELAQLFDVSTDNVGLHLKNIFSDGELDAVSVTEESSVTASDGKNYLTKLYSAEDPPRVAG